MRIGHASIKTTIDVYGRMVQDVGDGALDAFSRMRASAPASLALDDPQVPALEP